MNETASDTYVENSTESSGNIDDTQVKDTEDIDLSRTNKSTNVRDSDVNGDLDLIGDGGNGIGGPAVRRAEIV